MKVVGNAIANTDVAGGLKTPPLMNVTPNRRRCLEGPSSHEGKQKRIFPFSVGFNFLVYTCLIPFICCEIQSPYSDVDRVNPNTELHVEIRYS